MFKIRFVFNIQRVDVQKYCKIQFARLSFLDVKKMLGALVISTVPHSIF